MGVWNEAWLKRQPHMDFNEAVKGLEQDGLAANSMDQPRIFGVPLKVLHIEVPHPTDPRVKVVLRVEGVSQMRFIQGTGDGYATMEVAAETANATQVTLPAKPPTLGERFVAERTKGTDADTCTIYDGAGNVISHSRKSEGKSSRKKVKRLIERPAHIPLPRDENAGEKESAPEDFDLDPNPEWVGTWQSPQNIPLSESPELPPGVDPKSIPMKYIDRGARDQGCIAYLSSAYQPDGGIETTTYCETHGWPNENEWPCRYALYAGYWLLVGAHGRESQ